MAYGNRPMWQWVLIYLVIGGLVYFAVYYFFLGGNKGGYSLPSNSSTPSQNSTY